MKKILAIVLLFSFGLFSCENDAQQQLEAEKIAQENDVVFKNISKMWQFHFPEARAETKATLSSWNEWRQFEIEMLQKPKSSLLAFQLKTKKYCFKSRYFSYDSAIRLSKTANFKSIDYFEHQNKIARNFHEFTSNS